MAAKTMACRQHEPDTYDILAFLGPDASPLWTDVTEFLASTCGSKSKTEYSVCSMQRGWNVKYRKRGRAICTLYPEERRFRALVTLGEPEYQFVAQNRERFSDRFLSIYDRSKPMSGLYWLMLDIAESQEAEDLKRIAAAKAGVAY